MTYCNIISRNRNFLHVILRTQTWTTITGSGFVPSPREGHTATLVGSKMYIFGGVGNGINYNDVSIFDLGLV